MDILKYEPLNAGNYFTRQRYSQERTDYADLLTMRTTPVRRVTGFELLETKLDDGVKILAINPLGRISVSGESGTYGGSGENYGSTKSSAEWLFTDVKPEEFDKAVASACSRQAKSGVLVIDITREGLISADIRKASALTAEIT